MNDFDATLTPAERAAPTFIEWSDATLARAVRALAAKLLDDNGHKGITGVSAALALDKVVRDCNAGTLSITIGDAVRIKITILTSPKQHKVK